MKLEIKLKNAIIFGIMHIFICGLVFENFLFYNKHYYVLIIFLVGLILRFYIYLIEKNKT